MTYFECYTCNIFDGFGVCESCKEICHQNHNLSEPKRGDFECDCKDYTDCKIKEQKKKFECSKIGKYHQMLLNFHLLIF